MDEIFIYSCTRNGNAWASPFIFFFRLTKSFAGEEKETIDDAALSDPIDFFSFRGRRNDVQKRREINFIGPI